MNITRFLSATAILISATTGTLEGAPHPAPNAGASHGVPPPRYKIVDLGTLFQAGPSHNKGTGTPSISITTSATYSTASSMAYSINDRGQIVGYSDASTPGGGPGSYHAFLWQHGKMSDLGVLPQGTGSVARGINDKGQVVGQCTVNDYPHAFLWERGKMRDLGTLGGPMSSALAINNKGEVVGYSAPAPSVVNGAPNDGPWRHPWRLAMLWTERKGMTALGSFPDTFSSTANGINDKGQVSGSMVTVNPQAVSAVTWEAGKPRVVGHNFDPGGFDNEAGGINNLGRLAIQEVPQYSQYSKTVPQEQYFPVCINDAGEAVGMFWRSNDPRGFPINLTADNWAPGVTGHAFVWQHGRTYDLNVCLINGAGWLLTDARGINAQGEIVGYGFLDSDPKYQSYTGRRAFLLVPQFHAPPRREQTLRRGSARR